MPRWLIVVSVEKREGDDDGERAERWRLERAGEGKVMSRREWERQLELGGCG